VYSCAIWILAAYLLGMNVGPAYIAVWKNHVVPQAIQSAEHGASVPLIGACACTARLAVTFPTAEALLLRVCMKPSGSERI